MFEGVITALVTPFKNGQVDYASLEKLVNWQIANGVQGFVVNGTTGESPTLTSEEVERIFSLVKELVPDDFPILLGTGSNSTVKTIEKTLRAKELKAHGALVVVPYYNKPTQQGMIEHFSAVAKADPNFPILLYNVPGRTVVSMSSDTVSKLSELKNIVGIKEASGKMDLGSEILKSTPKDFTLTSGDDASCMELALLGGKGVISVISHLIPQYFREILDLARKGDQTARVQYKKFDELNRLVGIEPNPIPVKMGLYKMGLISSPELRLPLTTMTTSNAELLAQEIKKLGLVP